jgi:hypothetical protein
MNPNSLLDEAYHSAVLTGLLFANCMVAEKVLGVKPPNLGKLGIKDVGQLLANVLAAEITRMWLVKQKIIPSSIVPSTPLK